MLIEPKQYIVFSLNREEFRPFTKIRGPVSIDRITKENLLEVMKHFDSRKVPVFHDKLNQGDSGIFARYKSDVVGYMWYKDYDVARTVYADGYVPLKGRFTHLHFGRVLKEMRGRGLQLLMLTNLIQEAYERGMVNIFTDTQLKNKAPMPGFLKIGFRESFRLVVLKAFGRSFTIKYRIDGDCFEGQDSYKVIFLAEMKWMIAKMRSAWEIFAAGLNK